MSFGQTPDAYISLVLALTARGGREIRAVYTLCVKSSVKLPEPAITFGDPKSDSEHRKEIGWAVGQVCIP